jgi:glutamate dehydrogenase
VARDRRSYDDLWRLAEDLLTNDETAAQWRAGHVQTVQRQIGTRSGTDGSTGTPHPVSSGQDAPALLPAAVGTKGLAMNIYGKPSQRSESDMPLDEAKDELLQRAARRCAAGSEHVSPDEALALLRVYYRHVAPEDLLDRNPVDVYGPAMSQKQLAEVRPQGRAVVRAYTPTLEENGWDPGRSVVEVVTDDMPFLVDSVTMELDRHDIGIHLLVHPQMRVMRDVTGRMLGRDQEDVTGQVTVESWMHVEIDKQTDPDVLKQLEDDLHRVLADVRHSVEDFSRMRALAVQTAEDLSVNPPPLEPAEVEDSLDLLRWLADGHFTFLGYREYRLEQTDEGDALRAQPGTAFGILRDDKISSSSFSVLPAEVRSASAASSACSRTSPTTSRSRASRCCGASWPRCWTRPGWRPTATTART